MVTKKKNVKRSGLKSLRNSPEVISSRPARIVSARSIREGSNVRGLRKGPLAQVWGFIIWLVGVLVSLAVGFGMVDGTLQIPYLPEILTMGAGWIVVVLIILGALLKMIDSVNS